MGKETTFEEWFESLWKVYPRKVSKSMAKRACRARVENDKIPRESLERALENYVTYVKRDRTEQKFIMHGATFFGPNERWLDFVDGLPDGEEPACERGMIVNGTNEVFYDKNGTCYGKLDFYLCARDCDGNLLNPELGERYIELFGDRSSTGSLR